MFNLSCFMSVLITSKVLHANQITDPALNEQLRNSRSFVCMFFALIIFSMPITYKLCSHVSVIKKNNLF